MNLLLSKRYAHFTHRSKVSLNHKDMKFLSTNKLVAMNFSKIPLNVMPFIFSSNKTAKSYRKHGCTVHTFSEELPGLTFASGDETAIAIRRNSLLTKGHKTLLLSIDCSKLALLCYQAMQSTGQS